MDWISLIEAYADINHWSKPEIAKSLASLLRGARKVWHEIPKASHTDFDVVKKTLNKAAIPFGWVNLRKLNCIPYNADPGIVCMTSL